MAVLVFLIFTLSFKPVMCSGSVLDPIADACCSALNKIISPFATSIVNEITQSFAPNYDLYWRLTNHNEAILAKNLSGTGNIEWKEDFEYDNLKGNMAGDRTNPIISSIFSFSQKFGIAIATTLTLFFLFLCMLGQSKQIKDKPIHIIAKYMFSLVLITCSFSITYKLMSLFGTMWESFIMTSDSEHFAFSHISFVCDGLLSDSPEYHILGILVDYAKFALGKFIFYMFGIFLIWKLFKQFLRLYMECAERYFVLTMMTLFFPAIVPCIVSNSTSNVILSYIYMFFSQGFLLLVNGLFIKIYVVGFITGWWTSDIFGYICAIVFVKFATKIDFYMNSLGLNVAQTGGMFLDACGGAMHSIGGAIRTISHLDRMGQNAGASLMARGVANNNKATYERGLNMQNGLLSMMAVGGTKVSDASFSRAVANSRPTQSKSASLPTRRGQSINVTDKSFNKTAESLGMSPRAIKGAKSQCNTPMSEVRSINLINGNQEASLGNSTISQCKFSNGDAFVTSNENFYANATYASDFEAYNGPENRNNPLLHEEEISTIFGRETSSAKDLGFMHQQYELAGDEASGYNTYTLDVVEVSQHPESLNDNTRQLYSTRDGKTVSYKLYKTKGLDKNNEEL